MRIYYDEAAKNIVLGQANRLFATASLEASEFRGRVSIIYKDTNFRELFLAHSRILKEDGSRAGDTIEQVLEYLNGEFNKTPFVANASSMRLTTINVGSVGVYEAALTILDASVTPSSIITASIAGPMPTSKDADELEFDRLILHSVAGSGQFTLYIEAVPGPIYGEFPIAYGVA